MFSLIKSIPAMISLMLEIMRIIKQFVAEEQRRENLVKLEGAFSVARTSKDTTQLTALVNSIIASK